MAEIGYWICWPAAKMWRIRKIRMWYVYTTSYSFLTDVLQGYILTRVMAKGADALAGLEEREMEIQVMEALLCQKRWCRGKRGYSAWAHSWRLTEPRSRAWWERLALIYMNHLETTEENLRTALTLVVKGLEDPFTHTSKLFSLLLFYIHTPVQTSSQNIVLH